MTGWYWDGVIDRSDLRTTRAAAEADAQWLRGHPARRDRLRIGWGIVEILRVRESEWLAGEWEVLR